MVNGVKKTIIMTIAVIVLMFGFSFAMVPLYRVVCKVTGLNGGVNVAEINATVGGDTKRMITIQFLATNNQNLPWVFYPKKNTLKVYARDEAQVIFYAKNNSTHTMTVQAIPSFAPPIAARYFHKIECFCFRQQTLEAGEEKEMPVVFRIDPALPRDIQVITLAYTLFDVSAQRKSA